jgi:hypothetical protein
MKFIVMQFRHKQSAIGFLRRQQTKLSNDKALTHPTANHPHPLPTLHETLNTPRSPLRWRCALATR